MIEKIVFDYLQSALGGIPVYMLMPAEPPEEYVTMQKTGSSNDGVLKRATFAIQSSAGTLYRAAEINELVKAAMDDLITLDEVTRCRLNSDYNYTDTRTKMLRYQAVFNIIHY